MYWDSKVPGTSSGTKAAATPALRLVVAAGTLEENWISSSLPYQSREDSMALGERPRCLKSLGGIKMNWEMPRGGVYPLGVGCRLGHYQRNWGAG